MLKHGLQSIVRRFGYEFRRTDVGFGIADGYRVDHAPRWGYGRPHHGEIARRLGDHEATYSGILDAFLRHRDTFHAIPHDPDAADSGRPFWRNSFFSTLDAVALMGFLLERRPPVYLEIGCGHSTRFARHAIASGRLPTRLVSIDPEPRVAIDSLCDQVIRTRLEDCDLQEFQELSAGDILFFDGTHRTLQNSDVTVFFLEILPRLKPGVLVHIHDIFWPDDYPEAWRERLYSEQYVLGALLVSDRAPFRVVFPNRFVSQSASLAPRVRELFRSPNGQPPVPSEYPSGISPVSFWLETAGS